MSPLLTKIGLIVAIWGSISTAAAAHQGLKVVRAYAFDTTPGMANGAAYIELHNESTREARLVGVSSSVSKITQLHSHMEDGEVRRMVPLDLPLVLAPGETLAMEPGGVHLMLLGLETPLAVGDQITVTLDFEGRHARDMALKIDVFSLDQAPELIGSSTSMPAIDPSSRDHNHMSPNGRDQDDTDRLSEPSKPDPDTSSGT